MRVLLDTKALIWFLEKNRRLPIHILNIIESPETEALASIISVWEMAIKSSIGKLKLPEPIETLIPKEFVKNDIQLLQLDFGHVARSEQLPLRHRDPFDRLIIAQALNEQLPVVTSDTNFDMYSVQRIW